MSEDRPIPEAERRFVAKAKRERDGRRGFVTVWYIYDRSMGSWPAIRNGVLIPQAIASEAEAKAEADRLEAEL